MLRIEPAEIVEQQDYLVVANIPYYITSALIRHLLESNPRPRRIALTIQKEVAERIIAGPGDLSLLALSVQVYGGPRIAAHIPAGAFFPAPKVDSSVLVVDVYPSPRIEEKYLDVFFRLIKAGFSQKRKKLRNSISAGMRMSPGEAEKMLLAAGIDPQRRAETLRLEEWGRLSYQYTQN
jgi:16S rRNA (adenine1518-N6/adenine1519-N6)-dimethyltransferase